MEKGEVHHASGGASDGEEFAAVGAGELEHASVVVGDEGDAVFFGIAVEGEDGAAVGVGHGDAGAAAGLAELDHPFLADAHDADDGSAAFVAEAEKAAARTAAEKGVRLAGLVASDEEGAVLAVCEAAHGGAVPPHESQLAAVRAALDAGVGGAVGVVEGDARAVFLVDVEAEFGIVSIGAELEKAGVVIHTELTAGDAIGSEDDDDRAGFHFCRKADTRAALGVAQVEAGTAFR